DPNHNFGAVTLADTVTGTENAPFTLDPLANDVDPEGGPLTITAINGIQLVGKVHVIGGFVSLTPEGTLLFEPDANFRGDVPTFTYTVTDSAGNTTVGDINLTLSPSDTYIADTTPGAIADIAADAGNLADLGYQHIDVGGPGASVDVSLTDIQAGALINAGLDFVADDHVTVETAGTTTSTSLKGLQDLHIDTVAVHTTHFNIDAGAGGLGDLDAGSLPTFVSADGGPLDLDLDIGAGVLGSDVDLGALAPALAGAGVDHIDITGTGEFTLSADQALDIAGAGLDFVAADDITITTDTIDTVVANAGALGDANIDHIDVTGGSVTIDDGQASSLINAGLDFVDGDTVTLETSGTTTSTTLKGLQELHVDAANVHVTHFSIDAGGPLGDISPTGLPSFTLGQSDAAVDISLNIADGTLDPSIDLGALAPALGAAGIDHIDVGGSGSLTLSADQALAFIDSGVDFVGSDDITMTASASDVVAIVGNAGDLGAEHIDHIDVTGDSLTIDDTQAAALINAGLDFVASDDITVDAHGTHVTTSVAGLQALHVDTVTSDEGFIKLALGQIDETSALPEFDSSKDVTVDLSDDQTSGLTLSDIDHLTDLTTSLHDAGVDKIGIGQEFDTLSQDQLDTIAQLEATTGIDFVYDPSPVPTGDFGTLLSLLESHPVEPDVPGVIAVSDAATASLIESGALQSFLGETLVVDATDSGDHLLTSLKSLADLGVDNVLLSDHGTAPVYVDLGFGDATPTASELTQLLNTVDPSGANEPLFTGATHVGLVLDQAALDALAGVDGSLGHLADIGFTEIDVLGGTKIPDALLHDSGIEIKLIGIDDDLYEHLHHDK
ncbi:MAG: hypothetical protein JWR77_2535, partial [Rhizorhabdus sp.]|nr:hypothetical protein [Rhizorhabdus sp.]